MTTISISELEAARAAMTSAPWRFDGEDHLNPRVCDGECGEPNLGSAHHDCDAVIDRHGTNERNATGIVATHNAADALIAIAKAAMAWHDQRAQNLIDALAMSDAELDDPKRDNGRQKRTAELARAVERALARVRP